MKRPYGMHPDAFEAFLRACKAANCDPPRVILQTIGDAPASAGTHALDGQAHLGDGVFANYSAATDLRSRGFGTDANNWLWLKLIEAGFVGWWRHTGAFARSPHFHIVWPGCKMKRSLRNQVHSFLARRSGLVGDAPEPFLQSQDHLSEASAQRIRALFLAHNPADG